MPLIARPAKNRHRIYNSNFSTKRPGVICEARSINNCDGDIKSRRNMSWPAIQAIQLLAARQMNDKVPKAPLPYFSGYLVFADQSIS